MAEEKKAPESKTEAKPQVEGKQPAARKRVALVAISARLGKESLVVAYKAGSAGQLADYYLVPQALTGGKVEFSLYDDELAKLERPKDWTQGIWSLMKTPEELTTLLWRNGFTGQPIKLNDAQQRNLMKRVAQASVVSVNALLSLVNSE
jgi:hypothetical protein